MDGHDLDRTADAAIACALRDDADGLAALVLPMNAGDLRRLVARLAARSAESLTGWAADAGSTREDTLAMWQAAMLRAERDRTAEE